MLESRMIVRPLGLDAADDDGSVGIRPPELGVARRVGQRRLGREVARCRRLVPLRVAVETEQRARSRPPHGASNAAIRAESLLDHDAVHGRFFLSVVELVSTFIVKGVISSDISFAIEHRTRKPHGPDALPTVYPRRRHGICSRLDSEYPWCYAGRVDEP